jgi:rod shape determining protein RodA
MRRIEESALGAPQTHLMGRLAQLPWAIILVILLLGLFGLAVLYSAAGGSMTPWAMNQGLRLGMFLILMLALAQVDLEVWIRWAYPTYVVVLVSLVGVELLGAVSGGSQRWLDLGIIRVQPSEFMKIAIVLALARYYHFMPRVHVNSFSGLWPALLMIALPAMLVILQPDLGTATAIMVAGLTMLFLGGVSFKFFAAGGAALAAALPIVYHGLHEYQRRRVLIFLNPEEDPLGAGYHIAQSKIAIGSGGLFGKGFLGGTQSHLDYLPELHTDFVFATMFEEWGLIGGLFILACFGLILAWGLNLALTARAPFSRLAAAGLTVTLFFYVAINLAMVMGLAPVVGIPLPLVSYGGSAMMTVMIALGIQMSIAAGASRGRLGSGPSAL